MALSFSIGCSEEAVILAIVDLQLLNTSSKTVKNGIVLEIITLYEIERTKFQSFPSPV